MADLTVLRVFTGADGSHGNPLGVFVDGAAVPDDARQPLAARLGFSETVFVDDLAAGRVRIYTPSIELPFAGHPLVGTAWLLGRHAAPVEVLRPPAGEVPTWTEDGRTWIRGRADWAPAMDLVELGSAAEVEALAAPPPGSGFAYCWAWENRSEGRVRARAFAGSAGIAEDEATGAAAVRLVTRLDRALAIRQGRGSEILARPGLHGSAEIGGRVVHDETRPEEVGT